MTEHAEITTINPDDPALAVRLQANPPKTVKGYRDTMRAAPWTLELLERTLLEFRAAGAWDGAELEFKSAGSWEDGTGVTCEVLASRGSDAMPWGWRPSQGPPPPPRYEPLPNPVVPDAEGLHLAVVGRVLGDRVLHGLLLLLLVGLTVVFR